MGNEGVCPITSINRTFVEDAKSFTSANDYVFTIASINGIAVYETVTIFNGGNPSDGIVTIASIQFSFVEKTSAHGIGVAVRPIDVSTSDYVIALTSIYNSRVPESYAICGVIASNCVVTITGIQETSRRDAETGPKASTSDYIVVFSSIDAASSVDTYAPLTTSTRDCIVTITGIYGGMFALNSRDYLAKASDCVITLTSIYGAILAFNSYPSLVANASDYVVTITGINAGTVVENGQSIEPI
jgi:hypothetical protein